MRSNSDACVCGGGKECVHDKTQRLGENKNRTFGEK